jgi:hypothetical protein
MNELVKSITHFFYRDFFFILSGSTELASLYTILKKFGLVQTIEDIPKLFGIATPYIVLVYFMGLAYVLGYLTQELFNLTPLSTSNPKVKFSRFVRWVYKQSAHQDAEDEYSLDKIEKAKKLIYKESDNIGMNNKTRLERFASLKQIGTAVGSGFCVSSIILFISIILKALSCDYLFLPITLLVFGVALIILGWVKLIEQTEFALKYLEDNHLLESPK